MRFQPRRRALITHREEAECASRTAAPVPASDPLAAQSDANASALSPVAAATGGWDDQLVRRCKRIALNDLCSSCESKTPGALGAEHWDGRR